jgi:hypothetical protein
MLTNLICRVYYENGIDDRFIITDKKDNQFTIRESETTKTHYFVIPKSENNKIFWDYKKTEIKIDLSMPIELHNVLRLIEPEINKSPRNFHIENRRKK